MGRRSFSGATNSNWSFDRLVGLIPVDLQMLEGEVVDGLYKADCLEIKRQARSILQRFVVQESPHGVEVVVVYMRIAGDPYQRPGLGICQMGNHVQE